MFEKNIGNFSLKKIYIGTETFILAHVKKKCDIIR